MRSSSFLLLSVKQDSGTCTKSSRFWRRASIKGRVEASPLQVSKIILLHFFGAFAGDWGGNKCLSRWQESLSYWKLLLLSRKVLHCTIIPLEIVQGLFCIRHALVLTLIFSSQTRGKSLKNQLGSKLPVILWHALNWLFLVSVVTVCVLTLPEVNHYINTNNTGPSDVQGPMYLIHDAHWFRTWFYK